MRLFSQTADSYNTGGYNNPGYIVTTCEAYNIELTQSLYDELLINTTEPYGYFDANTSTTLQVGMYVNIYMVFDNQKKHKF